MRFKLRAYESSRECDDGTVFSRGTIKHSAGPISYSGYDYYVRRYFADFRSTRFRYGLVGIRFRSVCAVSKWVELEDYFDCWVVSQQ